MRDTHGCVEMMVLVLNEDARDLTRTPENEQSKSARKMIVNHCKGRVGVDERRIVNECDVVNYFAQYYLTGERKTGAFWCAHSCIKSYLMASIRIVINQNKLLIKLLMSTKKKHSVDKEEVLEISRQERIILKLNIQCRRRRKVCRRRCIERM